MDYSNLWEVELAVSLCQIGIVTLPSNILQMKAHNEFGSDSDRIAFYQHAKIGKALVSNIPRLEKIADGIAYQYKDYDGKGLPGDDCQGESIPWLARLLKVLLDYDDLTQGGTKIEKAVKTMSEQLGKYDSAIFEALCREVFGDKKQKRKKPIPLDQLDTGMILAADIIDLYERVLITQYTMITEVWKIRLTNYKAYHQIKEPISVYKEE